MEKSANPKDRKLLNLAKILRRKLTPQERRLWYDFLRTYPIKIYKQRIVSNYIVDFYCAKAKLVIELDGSGHYEEAQEEYDKKRTAYLERMGLHELRYTNLQIARQFREVCEDIYDHIAFAIDETDECDT